LPILLRILEEVEVNYLGEEIRWMPKTEDIHYEFRFNYKVQKDRYTKIRGEIISDFLKNKYFF